MLDGWARKRLDPAIDRIASTLASVGVSANAITFVAFFIGVAAAAAIAFGQFWPAIMLILVSRLGDALDGAVAARTTRPVIGIPVSSAALCGMDALFATVQMPPGFPVATVATDKAGARNAAWLAAQILAVSDPALTERIAQARAKMREEVEKAGDEISRKYA